MTPTTKLRFIERTVALTPFYKTVTASGEIKDGVHTYRILQQWWEDNSHDIHWTNGCPGEWRDIPCEIEA